MAERKPLLVSCVGSSGVKKWNFEQDEQSKKRKFEDDEDDLSEGKKPNKFMFRSSQSSNEENEKPKYVPKKFVPPTANANPAPDKDDELDSIDAYFAAMQKKEAFYRPPRDANFRPTPKTSLAGLPSAVPTRPLKENKARHVPNYIKKARQDKGDLDDAEEEQQDEPPKAKAFVRPQRQEPTKSVFKTASHQLAVNALRKNPQQQQQQPKNGVYGSFKSPLLNQQKPEEEEKAEIIDERLKNIDPKMVELIENEIMEHGAPVHWNDIAGLDFVKTTVKEIVVFPLLRPDIFHGLRGPPKGLLLFGPPGTGKTMIGRCIASQSKSTFFSISASSLTSKWVGEGEKMVRALFAVAKVHQPSVVFIDEIDSVLSSRSDTEHESSRRIKTEFLVQLDGASTIGEERILVVGATNRPQDLDEAARRRLVKKLYVPLPEYPARVILIKNQLKSQSHQLSEDNFATIADLTDGYSGADMTNLCKEAAMGPIRSLDYSQMESIKPEDVRPITFDDFKDALRQVKASVSDKDLQMYLDWNKSYGSTAK